MRTAPLTVAFLLALPLAHCSCQRPPDADAAVASPPSATASPDPGLEAAPAGADALTPVAANVVNGAREATSTLHEYLALLPGGDTARIDAFWAGAGPGTPADDALLRGVPDLGAMRIDNERPLPLDRQSPPQAYEIPVRLRLDTGTGQRRVQGHYRLRARVDGQGWEITSAELQPRLD